MALDGESGMQPAVQDLVVECVVYDRKERAKRRLVMPVTRLLDAVAPRPPVEKA